MCSFFRNRFQFLIGFLFQFVWNGIIFYEMFIFYLIVFDFRCNFLNQLTWTRQQEKNVLKCKCKSQSILGGTYFNVYSFALTMSFFTEKLAEIISRILTFRFQNNIGARESEREKERMPRNWNRFIFDSPNRSSIYPYMRAGNQNQINSVAELEKTNRIEHKKAI